MRRGVSHAKGGDYTTALKCYEQALELDTCHRDAYVARGAAFANQHRCVRYIVVIMNLVEKLIFVHHRFREASSDFETALEIDPTVMRFDFI